MSKTLEDRLESLEAQSLAQSLTISALALTIFQRDQKGLQDLRNTICEGIERAYERGPVRHEFLQKAIAETESIFKAFEVKSRD